MTLGNNINNIKTLVILIPHEGHHQEGEENESLFLDKHFVPNNAAINTGTTVLWFNGDVGHERTVDVKDAQRNPVFNKGAIIVSQPSKSFTFNNPGSFNYQADGDPGVTMTGSITVENIHMPVSRSTSSNTTINSSSLDTIGVIMVLTQDIDTYVKQIIDAGIIVEFT